VKREVEQGANDAVDTAENTSQSAFRIALNSYYKEGELVEVEEEVIDLIQTKIDALEQKINSLEDGETLEQAQSSLNEAKNSLENGDFDQTVEQIARGQELIALLEEEQKELEGVTDEENELNLEENDEDVPAEAQDSQNLELDDQIGQMIIQSTTTDGSVEDTILETTSETID